VQPDFAARCIRRHRACSRKSCEKHKPPDHFSIVAFLM
jgi:hypothetical protein